MRYFMFKKNWGSQKLGNFTKIITSVKARIKTQFFSVWCQKPWDYQVRPSLQTCFPVYLINCHLASGLICPIRGSNSSGASHWWKCKLQTLWRTIWRFLKKLKIELLHDPVIPLMGIYPKEMKTLIWKDTCTPSVPSSIICNRQDMDAT